MHPPWISDVVRDVEEGRTPVIYVPAEVPDLSVYRSKLSAEEQIRSQRFVKPADLNTFILGRWVLRNVLENFVPEAHTHLRIDTHGKPTCDHPHAPWFNLSHAGGWVALVLDRHGPVGIDIEDTQRKVAVEPVSRRYFSPAEQEWIQTRGMEGFFRIWTRKEARLKAAGTGLSVKVSHVDTLKEEQEGEWKYYDLPAVASLAGTVSCGGPVRDIRIHQWFPDQERLQTL